MNKLTLATALALLATLSSIRASAASYVIIAHPNSPVDALSEEDASRIYLGKATRFPGSGATVVPLDQPSASPPRKYFYSKLIKKEPDQVKAYWAQLIFTGKGEPPREIQDDNELKRLVANNPAMIGYIDASKADSSIKVVFRLP